MTAPTFSIVVPTYNQAQYLSACLDSILAQSDDDWEALVINDGSTDGTAELADYYARQDPRIRVFHKTNGGVANALNEGLRLARGSWVHWLSSDDLFDPCKLEINRKAILEFPDCKFFFSYFRLLRESTQELTNHDLWGPLPEREFQIPALFFRNYISGITICIERAAWQSVGYFDESLRYAQDYDMWLRLLARFPARFIAEWTVTNRNHALQGSEVFPQACYYDTAKAALLCLNRGSFESLFPLLDLTDPGQARRALEYSLSIAAQDSAFLYAVGWHPALLWRIAEWIMATEHRDPVLGKQLRTKVRWVCRQQARRLGQNEAAFAWKTIQAALTLEEIETTYQPIVPVDIAVDRYFELLAADNSGAVPIAQYLERFYHLILPASRYPSGKGCELALIVHHKTPRDYLDLVERLIASLKVRGWRVVLFVEGKPTYWMDGTTPVIAGSRQDVERLAQRFMHRSLLSSDITNCKVAHGCLVFPLDTTVSAEAIADAIVTLSAIVLLSADYANDTDVDRIPLVFLTRALSGGGAERVVHSLVHALDLKRFNITVIPLFAAAHPPVFEHGLVVESFEASLQSTTLPASASAEIPASTPSPVPSPVATKLPGAGETDGPASTPVPAPPPFIATELPGSLTRLANRLSPERLRQIKSIPFFPLARFGLRTITSIYRKILYGRQADRKPSVSPAMAERPIQPDTELTPSAYPMVRVRELSKMEHVLNHFNSMADYVTSIVQPFGARTIMISIMEEATIVAWLVSLRLPLRYVAWLHAVQSLYMSQLYPDKDDRAAHDFVFKTAIGRAQTCVFPSLGCCDDLVSLYHLPASHMQRINNPIVLSTVSKLLLEPPEKPFNLQPSTPLIVSLGRLSPEKGHDHLLAALSVLRQRNDDFFCLIIGDGYIAADVATMIKRYGLESNVEMLGGVRNPFPYLAQAKVVALTSKFESFAVVLLEAMASGAVPVSVDCPTGPKEVLDGGRAGILVPPNDISALADAIEKAIWSKQDTEEILAHAANWVKRFDIRAIITHWEKLLEDIAAKEPEPR
jgi:glycosyltransferase involved in cell wall biosynthesis